MLDHELRNRPRRYHAHPLRAEEDDRGCSSNDRDPRIENIDVLDVEVESLGLEAEEFEPSVHDVAESRCRLPGFSVEM